MSDTGTAVDWPAVECGWAAARGALEAGDVFRAHGLATRALGFEASPDSTPADGSLPRDTTSNLVHGALRRLGLERAEELAYRIGLKPVLYLTPTTAEIGGLQNRYDGHFVETVPGAGDRGHLFVSRDRRQARRAAEVYRHGDPSAEIELMGELMGYPRCCTQAFATLADRGNDSANLLAAAGRSRGRPDPLLNLAIVFLVSFFPCRLDCVRAGAFAAEVASALFPDPTERRRLRAGLARPTLFFDRDHVVVLDGLPTAHGARFGGASLIVRSRSPESDERLMGLALGAALDGATELRVGDGRWCFEGPRGVSILERLPHAPGRLIPFAPDTRTGEVTRSTS